VANGEVDSWAVTPLGRLVLIIVPDQFPRSVWADTRNAYSQDARALAVCLEGLDSGHFESLKTIWCRSVFKLSLEHGECIGRLLMLQALPQATIVVDKSAQSRRHLSSATDTTIRYRSAGARCHAEQLCAR